MCNVSIFIRGQTMYHSVFYNMYKGLLLCFSIHQGVLNLKNVEDPWVSTGKEMLRCLTPCVLVLEIQVRLLLKDTRKEPHVRCEPKMWTQKQASYTVWKGPNEVCTGTCHDMWRKQTGCPVCVNRHLSQPYTHRTLYHQMVLLTPGHKLLKYWWIPIGSSPQLQADGW